MQIAFLAMVSYSDVDNVKNVNHEKKVQVVAQYEFNKNQEKMTRMLTDPGSM
ncbi:hypothetical protein bthur0005_2970 [Bacillus thuringiensis serovar pakistani str. T13001]|nr:hypothetical protein bthur0005_2970 [Bacillus thuringiensis serovar pakistani str. T13001]